MNRKSGLPKNWILVKLGEISEFKYGKGLPQEKRIQGEYPVYGSNGVVGYHNIFLVPKPSIIVGRKGSAGSVHLSLKPSYPIDTTYYVEENNETSIFFLFYLLKSLRLHQFDKSTAIPGLNRNDAYKLLIPLPPLPEQHRIVYKIEELFSDIDNGIESLKKARAQLKIYRQAVLKAAFEGKLTNKNVKDGELPKGWKWVKLENIGFVQIGPFGSQLHRRDYVIDGIPLINPMHIKEGKIIADKSYSIQEAKRNSLPNYIIKENDIILGRRGEMGRCALVTRNEDGWFCGTGSLFIRPLKNVNAKWLCVFLGSSVAKNYLENAATGTTMLNLNSKIINQINVPMCSLAEQNQIVIEIEDRLSICDNLEQTIEQSLRQADSLKQSILKKAFEGKLVPQNPDDEPASVLLEKIRAERETLAERKKPNKPKVTKRRKAGTA